jgi:hypothetical protein
MRTTMAEKYRQRPDDYASHEAWLRFVESIDRDCNFELTDPPEGLDICFSDGSKHRLVTAN